ASRIENFYNNRLAIIIGDVESMVHVEMLKGLVKTDEGALVKEYGLIPGTETDYPAQAIVDEVVSEDQRFIEQEALPIEEELPVGSRAFLLMGFHKDNHKNEPALSRERPVYGRPVEVVGHKDNRAVVNTSLYFINQKLEEGEDPVATRNK
ncbi:hypothetical protein I5L01_15880, partial [Erythrobacter sp. YJ-T3-07]|nr:hypothetical protein [Erythrobacter sp. YJ-T3-07]